MRYHLHRLESEAVDGRSQQPALAAGYREAIEHWLSSRGERVAINLAALHDYLVAEHDYPGSRRSVQRFVRAHFPQPKKRARRRVETPPGAQAQVDWAEFRELLVAGERRTLYALHCQLSHSRFDAVVWSTGKDQLAWQHAHNEAFRRLQGIPATLRVDNEKTAVSRGAGAWGEINAAYRRYALSVRFHVDACAPRSPEHKGKVERRIRDQRLRADPRQRHWDSLEELQEWTDRKVEESARRRICPPTGTTVWQAWREERRFLSPVPLLPEPFDLAVQRRVGIDCMVSFEGRSYAVPFRFVGQTVEVRGGAGRVQILGGGAVVVSYERHTEARILIDPSCFEGEATDTVLPPLPLGRMGRRLQEIADLEPEKRPMDLYVALAEVAR